jgi:hypothetical protein
VVAIVALRSIYDYSCKGLNIPAGAFFPAKPLRPADFDVTAIRQSGGREGFDTR